MFPLILLAVLFSRSSTSSSRSQRTSSKLISSSRCAKHRCIELCIALLPKIAVHIHGVDPCAPAALRARQLRCAPSEGCCRMS
eukprot:3916253-Pleurochrysis_carterae.AAC.1